MFKFLFPVSGFETFKKIIYLAFLCLGIVFIYKAEILERYLLKRTNFYEFEETITEFPTLVIYPVPMTSNIKRGIDYNISFQAATGIESITSNHYLMENGQYSVEGSALKVEFESVYEYFGRCVMTVSPLNFKLGMTMAYALTLTFDDSIVQKFNITGAALSLTSENNSVSTSLILDGTYGFNDGKIQIYGGKLGYLVVVTIAPQKIISMNGVNGICRNRPFNELFFEEISREVSKECQSPCSSVEAKFNFGHKLNKILSHLPECKSEEEFACFKSVARKAHQNTTLKPCTKLQYEAETQAVKNGQLNEVTYFLNMSTPPKVTVKQEYLIYDLIGMIGAIGGTISLFTGFSFTDFCNSSLNYFQIRMEKLKIGRAFSGAGRKLNKHGTSVVPMKGDAKVDYSLERIERALSALRKRQSQMELELKSLKIQTK